MPLPSPLLFVVSVTSPVQVGTPDGLVLEQEARRVRVLGVVAEWLVGGDVEHIALRHVDSLKALHVPATHGESLAGLLVD